MYLLACVVVTDTYSQHLNMSSSEYGQNANRSKIDKQVKRIEKEVHMIDQLTRP